MEEKRNLLDYQRELGLTGYSIDRDVYEDAIKKLYVLRFGLDARRENIVSSINGIIAFIDRKYNGEAVAEGDVWFCSGTLWNNVYYVMPLRKITSSMIMGLGDDIRNEVIDTLWKANKREYERIFEDRFKETLYKQAQDEAKSRNQSIIDSLQDRIKDLERQLEQSRMVIDGKGRSDDGGVELFSEGMEPSTASEALSRVQYAVQAPVATEARQEPFDPHTVYGQCAVAPGMPEMRLTDGMRQPVGKVKCTVFRLTPETIQSDAFVDGKYFVHINPSHKFLVVRRHDYGSATCIDHKIRLDGLGTYSSFTEKHKLMAEYDDRYGGIIIHL